MKEAFGKQRTSKPVPMFRMEQKWHDMSTTVYSSDIDGLLHHNRTTMILGFNNIPVVFLSVKTIALE